jgi:hypothetical protein
MIENKVGAHGKYEKKYTCGAPTNSCRSGDGTVPTNTLKTYIAIT